MSFPSSSTLPMVRPSPLTIHFRDWLTLILLSVIWGSSYFFNHIALEALPVFSLVTARIGIALFALLIFLRVKKRSLRLKFWRHFLIMGALNNALPFSLIVWGQMHIASGLASIINAATPLFTLLLAHKLTQDENLTLPRFFGVLIGLGGVVFMIGLDNMGQKDFYFWGQMACVGSAISYAFAGIYGRRFTKLGLDPLEAATGQLFGGFILLLPVGFIMDKPWLLSWPSEDVIFSLLALGLLSSAIAYILYFKLLARIGAGNLMLVTLLVPVSANLMGSLWLQETLKASHYWGMAFIALGLAVIDGRLFKRRKRSLTPATQPSNPNNPEASQ